MDRPRAWPGPTDRCVIYVDRHGENTIVSVIDAARGFDPKAETGLERWIAPRDWVVLQGNLQPSVTSAFLALGREKGATTALNPSPTYAAVDCDWRLVDLVVVNRNEAMELGDQDDPLKAARALCEAGAAAVVLTRGAEGAALVTADETLRVGAPRVTAVYTVAAGDVLLRDADCSPRRALQLGGCIASCVRGGDLRHTRRGPRVLSGTQRDGWHRRARVCCGASGMSNFPTVAREHDHALKAIFGRANGVLIGVVHLLPLPAAPDHVGHEVEPIYERSACHCAGRR